MLLQLDAKFNVGDSAFFNYGDRTPTPGGWILLIQLQQQLYFVEIGEFFFFF